MSTQSKEAYAKAGKAHVKAHINDPQAQAMAVTGHLSSNEPNLQNIPIRTAEGRKVREAFVPTPSYYYLTKTTGE